MRQSHFNFRCKNNAIIVKAWLLMAYVMVCRFAHQQMKPFAKISARCEVFCFVSLPCPAAYPPTNWYSTSKPKTKHQTQAWRCNVAKQKNIYITESAIGGTGNGQTRVLLMPQKSRQWSSHRTYSHLLQRHISASTCSSEKNHKEYKNKPPFSFFFSLFR